MIVQALYDYYQRRINDPESGIAPEGWEWKALPFIVEIDRSGTFVQIADTRTPRGRLLAAQSFLVPRTTPGRTSTAIRPNVLWDNVEYALGIPSRSGTERVARLHRAFIKTITDQFGPDPGDDGLAVLLPFLTSVPFERLHSHPLWPELAGTNPFISFRLAGDVELICQREAVRRALMPTGDDDADGLCLVTGQPARIARLHPSIKGVRGRGSTTSGASLVSFNLDAFKAFGRDQGGNAPIGEPAAFAYTTALNELLSRDSRQKLQLADTTIVFWAERRDAIELEAAFAGLFEEAPRDDPGRKADAIASVYQSVHAGTPITSDDGSGFFVLALAPNAARLSVRNWNVSTVREVAARIVQHFDDLEVVLPPYERPRPSLYRLLATTAVQGRIENAPPNLAADVLRAILAGSPYPNTLLQAAVRRVRVARREQDRHDPMPVLAAVMKAALNRLARSASSTGEKELAVALDPDNPNPAYRLGRLFAVLERAQEMANPGINATIRERYYGAVSTTPVTVFSQLLRLKNHHVAKFDRPGDKVWIERQIGEIMAGLGAFPAHLTMAEQGAFAVGYYHQRQSFFAARSDNT